MTNTQKPPKIMKTQNTKKKTTQKYFDSQAIKIPFNCNLCNATYKYNGGLFGHYKKTHPNDAKPKRAVTSGSPRKMTVKEKEEIFQIFGISDEIQSQYDGNDHIKWYEEGVKQLENSSDFKLTEQQMLNAQRECHKLTRIFPFLYGEKQALYILNCYMLAFIEYCFDISINYVSTPVSQQLKKFVEQHCKDQKDCAKYTINYSTDTPEDLAFLDQGNTVTSFDDQNENYPDSRDGFENYQEIELKNDQQSEPVHYNNENTFQQNGNSEYQTSNNYQYNPSQSQIQYQNQTQSYNQQAEVNQLNCGLVEFSSQSQFNTQQSSFLNEQFQLLKITDEDQFFNSQQDDTQNYHSRDLFEDNDQHELALFNHYTEQVPNIVQGFQHNVENTTINSSLQNGIYNCSQNSDDQFALLHSSNEQSTMFSDHFFHNRTFGTMDSLLPEANTIQSYSCLNFDASENNTLLWSSQLTNLN